MLRSLRRNDAIEFVNEKYYLNCLKHLAENDGVIIPTSHNKLMTSTLGVPPRYNTTGGTESNWERGPGRRRIRRFASTGEFQRNGRVSSTCPTAVSGTTTDPGCTEFDVSGDRDSVLLDNEKLLSSINGPKPRKRKQYQCKICGQYNHNSSTCPGSGDCFVSSTSIKSGKYLVGTDPAIELGIDRSIYMEYGGNISFERDDLQQAVKKILSYTLLMGEEEFVATFEDIVYFVFLGTKRRCQSFGKITTR